MESTSATTANLSSYIEGIVRGYRNALLTHQSYGNLTQCETVDGTSLNIADSPIWQ